MNSFAQRGTDFNRIELLESVKNPTKFDKVNLCALIMRYGENQKVSLRLYNLAMAWDHSPVSLMHECRELWQQGYNPASPNNHNIGSANDADSDS